MKTKTQIKREIERLGRRIKRQDCVKFGVHCNEECADCSIEIDALAWVLK